ncbi:hypothetical protein [Dietzia sp.]|uniref:hypothetical protein n=1 Tax=Dietzia sp. TaxID=1871616 RepID=UPI002FD9CEB4
MNVLATQSTTPGFLLTGGATMLVVTATVLVVAVVLVPRLRPTLGLVSAVLALLGALLMSFTRQSTTLGDPVFRGTTVWWSIGLALLSSTWWWIGTSKAAAKRSRRATVVSAGAATRSGEVVRSGAGARSGAAPAAGAAMGNAAVGNAALGSPTVGGGLPLDDGERRGTRSRIRPAEIALVAFGAVTVLVAVGTFLVASGLYPMGVGAEA